MATTVHQQADSEHLRRCAEAAAAATTARSFELSGPLWMPIENDQADGAAALGLASPAMARHVVMDFVKGAITSEAPIEAAHSHWTSSEHVQTIHVDQVRRSEVIQDVAPCTPLQSFSRQKHQSVETPEPSHGLPCLSLSIGLSEGERGKPVSEMLPNHHVPYATSVSTSELFMSATAIQPVASTPPKNFSKIELEPQGERPTLNIESPFSLTLSKHENHLQAAEQSNGTLPFAQYSGHPPSHRIFASPGLSKVLPDKLTSPPLVNSSEHDGFVRVGTVRSKTSSQTPISPAFFGCAGSAMETTTAYSRQSSKTAKSLMLGPFLGGANTVSSEFHHSVGATGQTVNVRNCHTPLLPNVAAGNSPCTASYVSVEKQFSVDSEKPAEHVKFMQLLTGGLEHFPHETGKGKVDGLNGDDRGNGQDMTIVMNEKALNTSHGLVRSNHLTLDGPSKNLVFGMLPLGKRRSSDEKMETSVASTLKLCKEEPFHNSDGYENDPFNCSRNGELCTLNRTWVPSLEDHGRVSKDVVATQASSYCKTEEAQIGISSMTSPISKLAPMKSFTNSAHAQLPKPITTFSTGEPSLPPLALGLPQKLIESGTEATTFRANATSAGDWGKFLALSATPVGNALEAASNCSMLPFQRRFKKLQAFLKQCDESDSSECLQVLRSLPAAARSNRACELESRVIRLALEEGREMKRMRVLKVLGRCPDRSLDDADATPSGPRLPAPGSGKLSQATR